MATNTERPRRFDLRETIPLATETLVSLAKRPKRSWVIPALILFTSVALAVVMLDLIFSPGSASGLGFDGELRSRLLADYAKDPVAARIHELRLTIVEDVLGVGGGEGPDPTAIALLMKDPVPTAAPKATAIRTKTPVPSLMPESSSEPTVVATLPPASSTPPPTTVVGIGGPCDDLSITSIWVHSSDEVRASVKNSGSEHAYLVRTVFEWPDVPDPAYADWFEFDGDRYYSLEDSNSPTVSSGSNVRLSQGNTETWRVDFDDEPDEGIYGSFSVTMTFNIPGLGNCVLSRNTFMDIPATPGPSPAPGDTPSPPTAVAGYCEKLSITSMGVDGDDVEARVKNSGPIHVYLIKTVFEWPDVPDPAYVDWFEFDGDRYYSSEDSNSPTVSTGDYEKLRSGKTRKWEVDFDDAPNGDIYGSFSVTLTFDVPDQGDHCSLSRSTYKAPPAPSPEPTDTPSPTNTPEPTITETPEPSATATPAATDTPEPPSPTPVAPTPTP